MAKKSSPADSGTKVKKSPKKRPRRISPALAERSRQILAVLDETYPDSTCSLDHRDPFELLIATILSAQCTDARVNIVTKELFRRAPDARTLANVTQEELEDLVRTTGFFRNKAKSIRGAAEALVERHDGRVPKTMPELLALPGVARKTANVVLGTAFGVPSGVVVDTHVQRIAGLLGLTKETTPPRIEMDLQALLPEDHWIRFSHQLIEHGRALCIARRPRCGECPLLPHCPSAEPAAQKPRAKPKAR